jgi:arylsulfatase A-like enzyme
VGRVLDKIKALGLDADTIIFFTSDNGPHKEGGADPAFFRSSGPLRGIKRDLYEGGIRVPMIVRWPGHIKPGSVSDYPWAFWDFLPTAADLAGAAAPKDLDGVSVLPVLLGRPGPERECLYWEFYEQGGTQAVRRGRWKAVRKGIADSGAPMELYDLPTDLGETKDVAAAHPDLVREMAVLMRKAHTPSPHWAVRPKRGSP